MTTKLLVIDKDAEAAETLAIHFGERGYDVDLATNERDALNLLTAKIIRIVIIDIGISSSAPEGLLDKIRADFPATRLIVLSENPTVHVALNCVRNQAETLVIKPFDDFAELDLAVTEAQTTLDRWNQKLSMVVDKKRTGTKI